MHPALEQTYTIQSLIGQGGMSKVYLAMHKRLGTRWAVKEVSKHQNARFDFLAEANILKQLQHPMLPRIVDIFEDDQSIYIVEDFVEGITLETLLAEKSKVDESQCLIWFKELCGVLEYLHSRERPIIYRDMKPSNIMLQPDGTLKLIDFGIAREYKEDSQADTTYIGTKGYAAPEQFGKAQTDERTDIYSLGVTLYHLITGKSPYAPPYQFVPVRQLDATLSHGTEYILGRCTQSEPEERYQNVGELLFDLLHSYRFDRAYIRFRRVTLARSAILAMMLAASLALIGSGYVVMGRERVAAVQAAAARAEAERTAAIQAKEDQYAALLSAASDALESDFDAATQLLAEARTLFSDRPAPDRMEAYGLYSAGRDADCADWVEDALMRFPADSDLLLIGASAYFNLADYGQAADYFSLGAAASEMSTDNLRDYAVSLGRLGDIEGAQAALSALEGQGGASQVTAYVQGEMAYACKEYLRAEEYFLSALEGADTDALLRRCYLSLAETYRDSMAYEKSILLIDQGLSRPQLSGNTVLTELLGLACYNLGSSQEDDDLLTRAAQSFEAVIRAGVQKEYLFVNAFTAWQAVGQYEAAAATLEMMKAAWPRSYTPYALNATLLIMLENQKPESRRNYSAAYTEYQAASEHVTSSDETTQLQQLESLIEQLRAGGWIK